MAEERTARKQQWQTYTYTYGILTTASPKMKCKLILTLILHNITRRDATECQLHQKGEGLCKSCQYHSDLWWYVRTCGNPGVCSRSAADPSRSQTQIQLKPLICSRFSTVKVMYQVHQDEYIWVWPTSGGSLRYLWWFIINHCLPKAASYQLVYFK